MGKLYRVFLRWQGGEGGAAALGVRSGLDWILVRGTVLIGVIIAFFFRYSSLASLVSAVFAPVYYAFGDGLAWNMEGPILFSIGVMTLLLIYRHAENINRLVRGTESQLGRKKQV